VSSPGQGQRTLPALNSNAVDALADSPTYKETVQKLLATQILKGEQSVEVSEARGGTLQAQQISQVSGIV
jgi:hypothetical protein